MNAQSQYPLFPTAIPNTTPIHIKSGHIPLAEDSGFHWRNKPWRHEQILLSSQQRARRKQFGPEPEKIGSRRFKRYKSIIKPKTGGINV